MKMKKVRTFIIMKKEYLVAILLSIATFSIVYRNLEFGNMWSFSDLLPFDTQRDIDSFFGTWDHNLLGYPYMTSGIYVLQFLLELIIRNDIISQKIYYMSLFPLSFVTMYFLTEKFIFHNMGRYMACFLYALNPITIGEFFNGSTWMNLYALAPIIILFVVKFLDAKNIVFGLTISILFGLIASNLWIIFWTLLFPILLIMVTKSITVTKSIEKKNYLIDSSYLIIFLILGLLLLLPSIDYILFAKNSAFSEESIENHFTEIDHNYQEAILINILRMAGNKGSPMDLLGYDNNYNWWTLFGFIIPLVIIFAFFKNDDSLKNENSAYKLSFLFIISFIVIFMILTNLKLTYWVYNHITFLFSTRNPKYMMYSLSLSMSILFGVGIDKIMNIKYKRYIIFAIIVAIIFSLIVYLYPIWNGDMGFNKRYVDYTVPKYYYSTFEYIKNDSEYGRVLWLPYTYVIQTRLINSINHMGIRQGQDLSQSQSYDNIDNLFLSIKYNKRENISLNLGFYNVKYIVIDKDFLPNNQIDAYNPTIPSDIEIYYQSMTPYIRGPPSKFIRYFDSVNGIKRIYENEDILIYKNDYFLPYIFMSNILMSNISKNDIIEKNLIKDNDWNIWNLDAGSNFSINDDNNLNILNFSMPVTLTQKFNAVPGNKYKFSLMTRSQNSSDTYAKIRWFEDWANKNESEINSIKQDIIYKYTEIDTWKKYDETFVAPKNTAFGIIYLNSGKSSTASPISSTIASFSNLSLTEKSTNDIFSKGVDHIIPIENIIRKNNKFYIPIKTDESSLLVLSESYDDGWKSYINNTELEHIKILNWANGFKIPDGTEGIISIEYQPQRNRDIIIVIWILIWFFVVVGFIFLKYRNYTKEGIDKLKNE